MSAERPTLVDPQIEPMLESCENSKFTLVRVASMRAREITTYWSGLGRSQVNVIPPQVNSNSNKSLTMAFEELSEGKLVMHRMSEEEILAAEVADEEAEKAMAAERQRAFDDFIDA